MSDDLDPTVNVVTFIIERPGIEPLEVEYDVHGESEALALIEDCFKNGVTMTEESDKDDPHDLWDFERHYPPHRILWAGFMKRNDKPEPPEQEGEA